jgi:hypothetical protein
MCVETNHRFSEGSNIVLDCFSCLDLKNSFSKFDVDKLVRLAGIYHADFFDDDRGTIREQLDFYVLQVKKDASFSTCEDVQSLARWFELINILCFHCFTNLFSWL